MKKISVKGVIIGSVTDIVATNILALPLIIYIAATRHLSELPKDQISNALMQTLHNDPILLSTQLLIGSSCSILGGYIAARIAKHDEVLNGALASFLCVGSGLYALLFGASSMPVWQILLGLAASPALTALGGYLRLKTMRSKQPA